MKKPSLVLFPRAVSVPGFEFAGVAAAIKENAKKKDVALIYAPDGASAAGVFTRNRFRAAPVQVSERNVRSGRAQLVVINSGCANAATGALGFDDAVATTDFAARVFDARACDVLVCSTGKIGPRLPMDKLRKGILAAREQLNVGGFAAAAEAICTTDAYPKAAFVRGKLSGKSFRIAVMAKGAGMICPDMATMLCFVMTDLKVSPAALKKLLREAVDVTLNRATVDGDASTNDTVLMLASGCAQNPTFAAGTKEYDVVKSALVSVLEKITLQIVLDGEGATKCFVVDVSGAKSAKEAERAASAVANSQLVKAAMFGNDPNWGRIAAAVGYSGARFKQDDVRIAMGGIKLYDQGRVLVQNEKRAAAFLRGHDVVPVSVSLGKGGGQARVYASDLTHDYVRLNAEYRT